MRTVRRTRGKIQEERLVRRGGLLQPDPFDRLVREVLAQVVVVAPEVRLHRGGLVIERRFVLGCITAEETVETLEAESGGPPIERTRRSDLPRGREVRLTE